MDALRRGVAAADLAALLAELVPPPGPPEEVPLAEAAGRVCARAVTAPRDLPAVPTTRVDGYATPTPEAGRRVRVTGRGFPGDPPPGPLGPDEARFVMTGAPLPEGVAGVVPREQVEEEADHVRFREAVTVPALPAGGRAAAGEVLVGAGERIGPRHVGRLADFGRARVTVFPRPSVDILAVGSELHDPAGPPPEPGPVPPHYNSNGYVLAALVRAAGGRPRVLLPVPDDPRRIADTLAASTADVLLTTGGTARGAHDHTGAAIERAGFALRVEGLAARPGRTVRLATREGRLLVSLPGSAGAMGPLFALLVAPVLRRRAGRADPDPRWHRARLAVPVDEPRLTPVLAHATLALDAGALEARPARRPGNGFVLLEAGDSPLPADSLVQVLFAEGDTPL